MAKSKMQFPPNLLSAIASESLVLVIGGDLLEMLQVVPQSQYASTFIKELSDEVSDDGAIKYFFDIGFAFSEAKDLHRLNSKINTYIESLDRDVDSAALNFLASIRPRMIISTWYDSVFFHRLQKNYPDIKAFKILTSHLLPTYAPNLKTFFKKSITYSYKMLKLLAWLYCPKNGGQMEQ